MKAPHWVAGLPLVAWELIWFIGAVVLASMIAMLTGCAGHQALKRSLAVGLGATATAFLITSSTCADDNDASCRTAIYRGIAASFAVGVSAGTGFYLAETDEEKPYERMPTAWRPATMTAGRLIR